MWEYVGKEYSFGSVKKTVSGLSRDEMHFIEWLYRFGGTQTDNSGAVVRAHPSNNNGNGMHRQDVSRFIPSEYKIRIVQLEDKRQNRTLDITGVPAIKQERRLHVWSMIGGQHRVKSRSGRFGTN